VAGAASVAEGDAGVPWGAPACVAGEAATLSKRKSCATTASSLVQSSPSPHPVTAYRVRLTRTSTDFTIAPVTVHGIFRPPPPVNEPVKSFAPGTLEREELKDRLRELENERIRIPLVVGGKDVMADETFEAVMPHKKSHVLADVSKGGPEHVRQAIDAAREAHAEWSRTPWHERAAIFLRAAELLAGPWRATLNAATMLNQSKTAHQAEIDAACEVIDFWRFNTEYVVRIYSEQPYSPTGTWNRMEYRPLEGFVFAVSPFNFTAIGANLSTSPALMGNTVVWKPASTAAFSSYFLMRLLQEAGLPDGVINLVYGSGADIGDAALASPELAGIHFTGSTEVFNGMWRTVGENMGKYRNYPRIVGETGGKDFILAHPSADAEAVATAIVRGSFEYQGQKCSAASRLYVPSNIWPEVKERLVEDVGTIKMGDVADFENFMGAVIDASAFQTHRTAIEEAQAAGAEMVAGGFTSDAEGYFVSPTVIATKDQDFRLLRDELFGPIVTTYVYDEKRWDDTLRLVDETAPYGLTGAVFANERSAIEEAEDALRYAAGNFYVNDKPTGAVVGQQPFGGSRASGTNDKAGSMWNLIRWVSPRTIKETFVPPIDYRYPFLAPDGDGRG
jgi:1-pyrroline-5-carboxylate dehydrogenase